ncbi:mandelate racemase/muconate lactonizing enzyme family protein [Dinghuibacter silviterrae]|uniref:L-alanine-DL-glutamate epimerase-like enolase superfamily enzyme n=1 Tax=Dinghuibacter silviterrae TaxID=1539049 RepID=A0A4R8DER1_9BACT|nr:mandelate racemase/muconate lactonizing enzyme family protein [Dinghuibacter silviterrae]TDW95925.1 L-alanine-DL-glutamate epimerase-like enolase superfamily enzyme [Dinghuibacter silviterrae]
MNQTSFNLDPIGEEIFNIEKIHIRILEDVPAVTPFQDSSMGPFRTFNLSILTLEDEEGNIGEGPVMGSYAHVLQQCIFPHLLHNRGVRYNTLYPRLYWSIRNEGFRGPASSLLGQVDLALHDLACRRRGISLQRYLYGTRDFAKAYGSGAGTNYSYAELEKEMGYFMDKGFSCVKMKVGKHFGSNIKEDVERVRFVRNLIGKDVRLAVDANQIWTVPEALAFLSKVEDQDIAWFEEPVHSAALSDIARLSAVSPVSLSFGESEKSSRVFPELAKAGVTHLQPSPTHLAGVREWMEVRDLAEKSGLTFSSGGYSLYTAALVATASEEAMVEYLYPLMNGLCEYFSEYPILEKGRFVLPDSTGIPIRIDWDRLQRKNKILTHKTWTVSEVGRYTPLVVS